MPENIIFFRDGIGDSQFYEVFRTEIRSIRLACESIRPDYSPPITFIVAQKRHSIRFMTAKGNENVKPGTVVDELGHPKYFDFYLVSHHSLKGTARPVRYQVLLNENNYTCEDIQEFIHNYSYLYSRSTTAVSIVPPIYYAHLAAARAAKYVEVDKFTKVSEMKLPIKHLTNKLYYV